jgi:hypothetical protein
VCLVEDEFACLRIRFGCCLLSSFSLVGHGLVLICYMRFFGGLFGFVG